MMSLLFLAFFVAMLLAIFDRYRGALAGFAVGMALSTLWLLYHARTVLAIQL